MTHSQTSVLNDQHFNKSFTAEYSTPVTGEAVVTPTTGRSLSVKGIYLSTQATAGRIRIYFDNDEDGNENSVVVVYAESQTGYVPVILKGDPNEPIKVDSNITDEYFVLVNYREE